MNVHHSSAKNEACNQHLMFFVFFPQIRSHSLQNANMNAVFSPMRAVVVKDNEMFQV